MSASYGSLDITGDTFRFEGMPPHVAMRMRQVFPRIELGSTQPFVMRGGNYLAADIAWFLQRYPMRMSPETAANLDMGKAAFENAQVEVQEILGKGWKPTPNPRFRDGYAPYDYQAQAAEVAVRLGRLLIMDDVGLGKTVSAIAAIADEKRLPAAIVVQSHLAKQWAKNYVHQFTNLRAHVIKGRKPYPLPEADVYIFKYSNITGWVDYVEAQPFKAVIFDEIQELRHGAETAKGKAARVFTAGAHLRIGLSATPIYNYGAEMYNIIEIIEPSALGSMTEFLIGWCHRPGNHWLVKDPVALGSYLRDQHIVIRRDEHDAGWKMEKPNIVELLVDHDEGVVQTSRDLAKQLAMRVFTGSFRERGQAAMELDALIRRDTGLAKAMSVAAYVRMLLEAGRPVLLAGWHRDVYDIWLRELSEFKPVLYTGTETESKKNKAKQAFISGESSLMIISLRSGAGLDGLQHRGQTIVFGELDWSPKVHEQIIGRLRRPGQTKRVDAIYLHADFGSDPGMIEALGLKASQSHGIVTATETMEPQYSDISRIQKLAETYLQSSGEAVQATMPLGPAQMSFLEGA